MKMITNQGILLEQGGEDSLEYIALGLVALLVSAVVVNYLTNLISLKSLSIETNWS